MGLMWASMGKSGMRYKNSMVIRSSKRSWSLWLPVGWSPSDRQGAGCTRSCWGISPRCLNKATDPRSYWHCKKLRSYLSVILPEPMLQFGIRLGLSQNKPKEYPQQQGSSGRPMFVRTWCMQQFTCWCPLCSNVWLIVHHIMHIILHPHDTVCVRLVHSCGWLRITSYLFRSYAKMMMIVLWV